MSGTTSPTPQTEIRKRAQGFYNFAMSRRNEEVEEIRQKSAQKAFRMINQSNLSMCIAAALGSGNLQACLDYLKPALREKLEEAGQTLRPRDSIAHVRTHWINDKVIPSIRAVPALSNEDRVNFMETISEKLEKEARDWVNEKLEHQKTANQIARTFDETMLESVVTCALSDKTKVDQNWLNEMCENLENCVLTHVQRREQEMGYDQGQAPAYIYESYVREKIVPLLAQKNSIPMQEIGSVLKQVSEYFNGKITEWTNRPETRLHVEL